MGTRDRVTIELYVDDQGTVKIRNAKVATEELTQAATKGSSDSKAAADDFASSLMKQVGVYALVTAAAYKLGDLVASSFKAGIQAVDDFKLTTIGVAATLTDMAQDQSKGQENYSRALAYSKDMFNELELAAARYFAAGKEMTQAWNILAQKGIVLRKDEIDSLGVIVDRIKLSTQGQVSGIQIAQEMRALLTGQARVTDQIGMLLKDRIPNLEQEIAKHRQIGDLVQWLGDQFKGLKYASEDIQGTLESQKSTLETLLTQVGRAGLAGAYGDIVGILQQMNDYLLTHKDEVGGGIAQAWEGVKTTLSLIADILAGLSKGITIPISLAITNPEVLAQLNFLKGGSSGMIGPDQMIEDKNKYMEKVYAPQRENLQGWMKESGLSDTRQLTSQINDGMGGIANAIDRGVKDIKEAKARADMQLGGMTKLGKGLGASTDFDTDVGWLRDLPPNVKPPGGKTGKGSGTGGGGGGKGRDTTESLESLLMQLRQEEAKLTEGAFAGVEAWADKLNAKVRKLAMDDEQMKAGMLALSELKAAKEQKISDDLNKWYLGQMHQTTAVQVLEDKKKLDSVKGHAVEEGMVREAMAQHALERAAKLALAEDQQQKAAYDSLAQNSVLIADQVFWKEKSWEAEKKITAEQLEQWFIGKDLNNSQKDNYRGLLALTNQAKEYNQARQKAVDLGTLEGWAIERAGEALKKNTTIKDAMTGIESFFEDALTQGIQGALSKTKTDWAEVAATMAQSLVLNLAKKGIHEVFTRVAQLIAGGKEQRGLSPSNPLYVSDVGSGSSRGAAGGIGAVPAFERKAEKIGYTLGGGEKASWAEQTKQLRTYDKLMDQMFKGERKDLGGIQKLQDHYWKDLKKDATTYSKLQDNLIDQNQELFRADYLTEYQSTFSGMVGNITSVWQLGQGLMTAAGASGEAQRIAGIAGFAMQGISILAQFAKSAILMEAWQAAAAAYKSAMAGLPFPINAVVAPVYAAATFVAVSAMGAFGSGMGGGSTLANSPGMQSTGAGYTEGYHAGGLVAHSGLLVAHNGLANDERLVKVLTGEPILRREAMAEYTRRGISFDMLNSGRLPAVPVPVGGGDSGGHAGQIIQHHTTTHVTVVTQDGKVISKQTKREIINLMKDKDVQREIGVRVH